MMSLDKKRSRLSIQIMILTLSCYSTGLSQQQAPAGKADATIVKKPSKLEKIINKSRDATTEQIQLGQFASDEEKKRLEARMEARNLQQLGEQIDKTTTQVTENIQDVVNFASEITGAASSVEGEAAITAINIGLLVSKHMGTAIGKIVTGVGLYKESHQYILSATEQLVETLVHSSEKIVKLNKKIKGTLVEGGAKVQKQPQTDLSRLEKAKKVGASALNAPNIIKGAVNRATDDLYLSQHKEERLEKLKALQDKLAKEKIIFNEILTLLEIKIIEESIKTITKNLNKENMLKSIKLKIEEANKELISAEQERTKAISDHFHSTTTDTKKEAAKRKEESEKKYDALEEYSQKLAIDLRDYEKLPDIERSQLMADLETLKDEVNKLRLSTKAGQASYLSANDLDSDLILNIIKLSIQINELKQFIKPEAQENSDVSAVGVLKSIE